MRLVLLALGCLACRPSPPAPVRPLVELSRQHMVYLREALMKAWGF